MELFSISTSFPDYGIRRFHIKSMRSAETVARTPKYEYYWKISILHSVPQQWLDSGLETYRGGRKWGWKLTFARAIKVGTSVYSLEYGFPSTGSFACNKSTEILRMTHSVALKKSVTFQIKLLFLHLETEGSLPMLLLLRQLYFWMFWSNGILHDETSS